MGLESSWIAFVPYHIDQILAGRLPVQSQCCRLDRRRLWLLSTFYITHVREEDRLFSLSFLVLQSNDRF